MDPFYTACIFAVFNFRHFCW